MRNDEALERWLDVELPDRPFDFPVTSYRLAARAAWRAAVKHTLEHVAGELDKESERLDERKLGMDAIAVRATAAGILQMKP